MGLSLQSLCLSLLIILAISGQAYGFGAGNIATLSKIEGQNWRHGDIEDTLLTLFLARVAGGRKFSKLDVKRVYFGNWLRDYSQAVDVGTVKHVSAEAIRILIWVLGFMSFGYGTREFEVTAERLGCYQPTEHIDNPLGYAEGDDARRYDRRLRGPVDEQRELSIDTRTGLKNYIASEDVGIDTSAALIRRVLGRSIELGRRYGRSRNDDDLHEALRLLGTGLHCLEDYAAHSNYTELSLIELGERDVFPHVGRNTKVQIRGAREEVYPIVTGTFGGVDFFHSVLGEFSDKTKQSELQSLEGVISESENDGPSNSMLQDLLSKIPSGLIGSSSDQAGKMDDFKAKADDARQNGQNISPRQPEEWTRYLENVQKQIYPVLEWHDELLKSINEAIETIPVLPDLIEQVQDEITVFVFSVLAPYILPIIQQAKSELETGSSEVIQSSRQQQHIVFNDDNASNPTHSMLSKDHFSNILNEPAGQIASQVVKWTVPQLMQCWDDENIDIDRTLNRIISGVFHHPALHRYGDDGAADMRGIMFSTVEHWWGAKSEGEREGLRDQLSRNGVREGRNHKEGVQDCGHGCGKPLALPKKHGKSGGGGGDGGGYHQPSGNGLENLASQAVGGGALGGLVGGLVSSVGSMVLEDGGSDGRSGPKRQKSPKREKSPKRRESPQRQKSPKPRSHCRDDEEHEHRHRPHERREEYETPSSGHAPPPPRAGYEHQSESTYSERPALRNDYGRDEYRSDYSRNDYPQQESSSSTAYSEPPALRNDDYAREEYRSDYSRNDYPPNPPPVQSYRREEYRESQQDNGGYYQQESRQTYESGRTEYQRTETRYDYGAPQSTYETVQQSSFGGGRVEQEYSSGYGAPPRGGYEGGYERPSYQPREENCGQSFGGSGSVDIVERRPHHERRSSGGSGSGSGSDDERRRRRHHHHRRRSGSGSD
ncbi:uncharacterized protein N7482_001387 [Penicillium canariense]|uniref:NIMA-interacting protein TinC n=1 Tax=Penicillium canariense TaxID=189055 RepID=A0A9W9IGJ6_9EURO|nr:uncharacterized protein N7482_001387 [Penicillium canariense]KAJ5175510.1 hypothetical protein N7482_001387 [Penicillium canariense]